MTTENGLPRMAHVRRNIQTLVERLEYLVDKQDRRAYEGQLPDPFVTAEINALTWALPVLEAEWDSLARLRRFIMETERRSENQIAEHEASWRESKERVAQRTTARSKAARHPG